KQNSRRYLRPVEVYLGPEEADKYLSAGKSMIGGNKNYYQRLLAKDTIEII
ncbi:24655_t:CDS:2, partial [Entrophospora sp. SA101]